MEMMVFGANSHGKKMEILERAMDANMLRRDVIADNVANADTPFFKRMEVSFESQLRRAIDSEKEPEFPNLMTSKKHIPFKEVIDYRTVAPKLSVDYDTMVNNNKNSVDIEKEMVDATKTSLEYNMLLEIYNRNIRMMDIVMRG